MIIYISSIFALYVACPFLFYYFKRIRDTFVFSTFLNFPPPMLHSLQDPRYFGVENAENISVLKDKGLINAWSIKSKDPIVKDGKEIVVLYCHGQSCNRAMSHRVGMYNTLSKMGFNVVTFDYCGFGDSQGPMASEISVVEDTYAVLKWVEEHFSNHHIFCWGHSLGTGIAVQLLSSLENCSHRIDGLVLESPFLNLAEAGKQFPVAKLFDFLPFTKGVISNALLGMFPTDKLIAQISIPILILHAENDIILPVCHSYRLFEICESKTMNNVKMEVFKEGGHKFLFENKNAMEVAALFLKD